MTNDDGISIYANLIKEEGYPLGFSAFWLIGKISQYAFRDILSLLHLVVKPLIPVRGGVTPHPWANDNSHALRSYNDSCSAWISPYCACTRGSICIRESVSCSFCSMTADVWRRIFVRTDRKDPSPCAALPVASSKIYVCVFTLLANTANTRLT